MLIMKKGSVNYIVVRFWITITFIVAEMNCLGVVFALQKRF